MCLPNAKHVFKLEREWEAFGLQCAVVQGREGSSRCGYVRVPPGHPLHGKNYDDFDIEVHGGLTFAEEEPCAHEDGIGWWFGFDCAHAGDAFYDPDNLPEHLVKMQQKHPGLFLYDDGHFWTQSEVEAETERLAERLANLCQMTST